MAQKNQPRKGDWYSEVQNIIKDFEINITEEGIRRMPTNIFKKMVKTGAQSAGLKYLQNIQERGSKGNTIEYQSVALQDYLNPYSNLNIEDQRFLFSLRCEVNPLSANFRRNTTIMKTFCVKIELYKEHLVFLS